ncbi:MAG: nucleotidyltransferase family protein [Bacteroidales bacterium]
MNDISKYIIPSSATLNDALIALNNLSGDVLTLLVVDQTGKMLGTLTDGDVRRNLIVSKDLQTSITEAMNVHFKYATQNHTDVRFIHDMREAGVILLPVLDENKKIVTLYNLKKLRSVLPIDAVLMAGGKGERLRPLTERIPKPLLPVNGKPIIDYNIERLIHFGVNHISVTVNYLKEQIEEHFSKPIENVQVQCVPEPRFLGTIGSLSFIENFNNDTILIMNSDLFTNIDYEEFFLHFKDHQADMSVASVPYTVNIPYGIFELEGRDIKGVVEKPTYNYYANAGIYLIKKDLLKLIPRDTFYNATDLLKDLIENGYNVIRFPITGYWLDIGNHSEYAKACDLIHHIK